MDHLESQLLAVRPIRTSSFSKAYSYAVLTNAVSAFPQVLLCLATAGMVNLKSIAGLFKEPHTSLWLYGDR
jgi:hypothetical protein